MSAVVRPNRPAILNWNFIFDKDLTSTPQANVH